LDTVFNASIHKGPSIYYVHTEGSGSGGRMQMGNGISSTQKIKTH